MRAKHTNAKHSDEEASCQFSSRLREITSPIENIRNYRPELVTAQTSSAITGRKTGM